MPDTSDETGLLAAVRANPADDTPRLVYADWLQEFDTPTKCIRCDGSGLWDAPLENKRFGYHPTDPCPACNGMGWIPGQRAGRAEFIRVGCELAALVPIDAKYRDIRSDGGHYGPSVPVERIFLGHEWGPRYYKLQARERELLTRHHVAWFDDAANDIRVINTGMGTTLVMGRSVPIRPYTFDLTIRRGFAADFRGPLIAWCGGPCNRCAGDGLAHGADRAFEWSASVNYGKCVTCQGIGKLDAKGPALVRAHPIEVAAALDKISGDYAGGTGDRAGYWWEPGIEYVHPHQIPFPVAEAGVRCGAWRYEFHGGLMVCVPPTGRLRDKGWDTAADAHTALSAALIESARGAS